MGQGNTTRRLLTGCIALSLFAGLAWALSIGAASSVAASQQEPQTGILFINRVDNKPVPYMMHPDGTGKQPVAPSFFASDRWVPAIGGDFSPDGTVLAFGSVDLEADDLSYVLTADMDVYLLNLATNEVSQLTTGPEYGNYDPVWSPDSTAIAYNAGAENGLLRVIDIATREDRPMLDGGILLDLVGTTGYVTAYAWSPDSGQLAASATLLGPGGYHALFVMDADGSNLHLVLPRDLSGSSPSWSPAGDRLYYVCWSGETWQSPEICTLDLTTSRVTQVSQFGSQLERYGITDLDVSAQGQIVMQILSLQSEDADIYRYDPLTGEMVNLTADIENWVGGAKWVTWPPVGVAPLAQTREPGRIVYLRTEDDQSEAIALATGQSTPFAGGYCSRFSPQLDTLARFLTRAPDQLAFFDLDSGTLVSQVPWQAEWERADELLCTRTGWQDGDTFLIPSAQDPDLLYHVERVSGEITGPFRSVSQDRTPQIDPESSLPPFYSPSGEQVVYRRCDRLDCVGSTRFVIYDIPHQQVIGELEGSQIIDFGPPRIPELYLSWSPSSRFLAHATLDGPLAIFDLSRRRYVEWTALPGSFESLQHARNSRGARAWSPDSNRVAFPVSNASILSFPFDSGIAILDVETQILDILPVSPDEQPRIFYGFAWTPSGESLLIIRPDSRLYELNLTDETQTFLADHVTHIMAWYPGTDGS